MNDLDFMKMCQDTYPLRDMRFYRDDSIGDHIKRMRKADRFGREEKGERLHTMMAEKLVAGDATTFAKLLQRMGMKFRPLKGIGKDSFIIEGA